MSGEKRDVVIKVLDPDLSRGLSVERFSREIKVVASLHEPHIVPVLSTGVTPEGLPYYTMPVVRGESLRERMQRGRIPIPECVGILRDVARALAYAHRQSVIHCDIKPENVLLSFGTAMVTDFGIAKALSAARRPSFGGAHTRSGTSLGTPAYMSPEQAAGREADARTDLYAWGVMAYEMVSGSHPFPGKVNAQQHIAAHVSELPVHLVLKLPSTPVALSELIMRCLEKDPALRPAAATELVRTLGDPGLLARLTPRSIGVIPAPNRRRYGAGLAAAAVVAAFVFGAPYALARLRGVSMGMTRDEAIGPVDASLGTTAVLPFANIGGEMKNEYLSDGMTDEVAHTLARVPGVRVAGRTSSYAFKGKPINALEVGRTLGVGGVITGSVQRLGTRLRVTARLTSANDGLVLWSEQFERNGGDVYAMQDHVASRITAALSSALRGSVSRSVTQSKGGTASSEAYDLFLHGRYYLLKRGGDNLKIAADYFRQAIARDPRFSRAYAGLSMAYMPASASVRSDSIGALATAAAERALVLDSGSADAHLAIALAMRPTLRYRDAEQHLVQALTLLPGDAMARQWHADNLIHLGRVDEGLAEARAAVELDPLSFSAHLPVLGALFLRRQFDDASQEAQRLIALDSTLELPRVILSNALALGGRVDSAIKVQEALARRSPRSPGLRGAQLLAYAAANRWGDAARVRDAIRAERPPGSVYDQFMIGVVYREFAAAMRVLDRASTHATDMYAASSSISCDPMFDPIKTDSRFLAFVAAHGMRECPVTTAWPVFPRRTVRATTPPSP